MPPSRLLARLRDFSGWPLFCATMRTISYKRDTLVSGLIFCLLAPPVSLYVAAQFDSWQAYAFAGVLTVCLPFVAYAQFVALRGDRVALAYDESHIRIASLYKNARFSWAEIAGIRREALTQSAGFGLFKRDIANYIVFAVRNGSGQQEIKVQTDLLDVAKNEIDGSYEELVQAWQRVVPGVITVSEPAKSGWLSLGRKEKARDPLEGARAPDSFDPDAAIARYLAGRDAAAKPRATPPLEAQRSFGRKGL